MKHGAPAAFAMGVDQRIDRRVDAGLRQRRDDEPAFPFAIAVRLQCCIAQPPQTPKCGQTGAMRSGLAFSTVSRCRRSGWPGAGSTVTVSPGSV